MDIKNKNKHLTNDELLVDYIKDQLEEKMQASAMDINVTCRDGVAQLSGFVDVLAEKKYAEKIAKDMDGIKKIENSITIGVDSNITDKHMEKEVRERLFTSEFKGNVNAVGVKVNNGVANLVGHVDKLKDSHIAMDLASRCRGIKDVVNNIKVDTANVFDDVTINNNIHGKIENKDIGCDVKNGVATLIGYVDNKAEAEFAKEIAMDVEGVTKVKNMIKIRKK
ncbi:BON domain-containing protein [Dethiothermospora halolimnae]|uniref:BON domain-containing protein n=1 Tax=Dethiothermospora halolimnae TaxID=3114390 RepID=UPI003CCBFC8C